MPTEQQKITDLTEMFLYACKGVFTARFYLSFPQFEKSYFSVLERILPCLEHSSEIWFSQSEHMNQNMFHFLRDLYPLGFKTTHASCKESPIRSSESQLNTAHIFLLPICSQSNSLSNISNKKVIIQKAGMYYIKALRQLPQHTLLFSTAHH